MPGGLPSGNGSTIRVAGTPWGRTGNTFPAVGYRLADAGDVYRNPDRGAGLIVTPACAGDLRSVNVYRFVRLDGGADATK